MAILANDTIKRIKTAVCRALVMLGTLLFAVIIALLGIIFLIERGPSEAARVKFVCSVKETSAAGFMAHIFLSDKEVDEILRKTAPDEGENIDKSLIKIPDFSDVKDVTSVEGDYNPDSSPSSGENNIEVIDINGMNSGKKYHGKLMIIRDPSRVSVATLESYPQNHGLTIEEFCSGYAATAIVNGGGFLDIDGVGKGGTPTGIVIGNGKLMWETEKDKKYSICGFDKDGVLIVGSMTGSNAIEKGVVSACCYGPALIMDGEILIQNNSGLNPRTAIGQRADGAILLLTIEGRMLSSLGASYLDLAEILYEYGAVNATNLDGGSSTMMIYNGKRLIDDASMVGDRYMPTAIVVK